MKKRFDGFFLLSDFDGTLTGSDGEIPAANERALCRFTAQGGLFTVCTGRTRQGFHRYELPYINAPVLLANGAYCYDYRTGQTLFLDGIGAHAHDLIRAVKAEFPLAAIEMYPVDASYVIHPTDGSIRHFENQSIAFSVVDDPAEAPGDWQKAMVDAGDRSAEFQRWLAPRVQAAGVDFIPTDGAFVEIVKRGVSKATGAAKLARALGIDPGRCFVCGDGDNDADMLASFESFCPAGGSRIARESARHIVRGADDGAVAAAVEYLEALYE